MELVQGRGEFKPIARGKMDSADVDQPSAAHLLSQLRADVAPTAYHTYQDLPRDILRALYVPTYTQIPPPEPPQSLSLTTRALHACCELKEMNRAQAPGTHPD